MSSSKCLAILWRLTTLPTRRPILSAPRVPAFDGGGDRGESGLGGDQQLVAFAGPLGGQGRVAAGDEALAGVVGVGDLGQVGLVEQAELQGAGLDQGLIAGARSEVTQPSPPTSLSASMRAVVIIPRSPTRTTSVSPKRSRTVARRR